MRWLIAFLFMPSLLLAQSGPSKRAWKNYADKDFEKAQELVVKGLQKDSLDAMAWFIRARLSFTPEWQPVDIPAADTFLKRSVRLMEQIAPDQLEEIRKEGISSSVVATLRQQIDSAAFVRARESMTETAFVDFLEKFPAAEQTERAISLRDSLAFVGAVNVNTYHAYQEFMDKYPQAEQVAQARARYEKLYFDIATENKTLESYRQFLIDNPATPYRDEAEFRIFQIMTAANDAESYLRFIDKYPRSNQIARARNYLYYIYSDSLDQMPARLWTDSLRSVAALDGTWIPFYASGKYGFMDRTGEVRIQPVFPEIYPDYLCNGLTSDVIINPEGELRNRNLDLVAEYNGEELVELPLGLLKIRNDNSIGIIHKSGYRLLDNYEDAAVIGRLIGIRDNEAWGLASLTGQVILPPRYEEIIYDGGLYFLDNGEGWQILTPEEIFSLAGNKISTVSSPQYDEFHMLENGMLWLREGSVESLVDRQLQPVIAPARQQITILPTVYVIRQEDQLRILRHDQMQRYTTGDAFLDVNDRWLVIAKESGMGLFSLVDFRLETQSDSVRLIGRNFAVTYFGGNRRLHSAGQESILLPSSTRTRLLQADQREWILLEEPRNRQVINRRGQTIYNGQVENVTPLTDSLLVLERYGRKELLTLRGEKPLQVRFDGIASPEDELIPLLSGQRFGAYDRRFDRFVRPVSTKKIRRYNDNYYVAEMEKYGLINEESRMAVPFEFDEIRHWNDTTCLVRSGSDWLFYHIGQGLLPGGPVKSIQYVINTPREHEIIVFRDGSFGVFNSLRGEVIPPTLDDILNIGTREAPLYLSDKYVPEANLHVVVYFDREGNILRKEAFEEADFDKIYCD